MTRSVSPSYDEDFFAWTQEQAAALRRLPPAAPETGAGQTGLDTMHLAEEIEDLGKRDLRDVTSFLARLFERLIKISEASEAREVAHWHGEAVGFQIAAAEAFSPSMSRSIDMDRVWQQGRRRAAATLKKMGLPMSATSFSTTPSISKAPWTGWPQQHAERRAHTQEAQHDHPG